jgi:Mrp family chromosome partitioning ATPase
MSRIFKALERAEAGLRLQPGPRLDPVGDTDDTPPVSPSPKRPSLALRSSQSLAPPHEPGQPESRVELARLKIMLGMAARATDLKSVMLLSARAGEGVSTVALGLAQEMAAGASHGVLLVETRGDRHDLADGLEVPPGAGFSELLAKSVQREEAIAATAVPRLFFLGKGRERVDLSQARWMGLFEELLADLRSVFDFIVIDGGSLEQCTDSLFLARAAEGVILVVDSLNTTTTAARRATESLRGAGVNLLGVVLNRRRNYVPGFLANRL